MGIGGDTVKLLKNKMRSWENFKGSGKSINSSSGENIQLRVLIIDVFNEMEGWSFKAYVKTQYHAFYNTNTYNRLNILIKYI